MTRSLTQQEADDLLALIKVLSSKNTIHFPGMSSYSIIDVEDKDTGEIKFKIDIQRKSLNIKKCTYQTRHEGVLLLRLDIEGPPHANPDGHEIPTPHLHIYREGFALRWAYPLSNHIVTNSSDLVQVLIDFLDYNNVINRTPITDSGGGLV